MECALIVGMPRRNFRCPPKLSWDNDDYTSRMRRFDLETSSHRIGRAWLRPEAQSLAGGYAGRFRSNHKAFAGSIGDGSGLKAHFCLFNHCFGKKVRSYRLVAVTALLRVPSTKNYSPSPDNEAPQAVGKPLG